MPAKWRQNYILSSSYWFALVVVLVGTVASCIEGLRIVGQSGFLGSPALSNALWLGTLSAWFLIARYAKSLNLWRLEGISTLIFASATLAFLRQPSGLLAIALWSLFALCVAMIPRWKRKMV